jgi:hypothetical protein
MRRRPFSGRMPVSNTRRPRRLRTVQAISRFLAGRFRQFSGGHSDYGGALLWT